MNKCELLLITCKCINFSNIDIIFAKKALLIIIWIIHEARIKIRIKLVNIPPTTSDRFIASFRFRYISLCALYFARMAWIYEATCIASHPLINLKIEKKKSVKIELFNCCCFLLGMLTLPIKLHPWVQKEIIYSKNACSFFYSTQDWLKIKLIVANVICDVSYDFPGHSSFLNCIHVSIDVNNIINRSYLFIYLHRLHGNFPCCCLKA